MPSEQPAGPLPEEPGGPEAQRSGGAADPGPAGSDAAVEPHPSAFEIGHPSVLGVSRLSRRPYLSPAAEALYRRIARLAELGPESEFLLAPSARGLTTRFMADVSGASGAGVDPNAELTADATERARVANLSGRLHFDVAPIVDLPYQDDIFDFAMGELGLGASGDPAAAVSELVRVVKPMGNVALLQLVWTRQLDDALRESLVRMLGLRPMLLVEWKQMLRDAGVVGLQVEDLTDAAAAPQQPLLGIAGLVDFYSLRDRFSVLWRAWRRWGWRGVREAVLHGNEVRRLIARERMLGLAFIRGTKWRGSGDRRGERRSESTNPASPNERGP